MDDQEVLFAFFVFQKFHTFSKCPYFREKIIEFNYICNGIQLFFLENMNILKRIGNFEKQRLATYVQEEGSKFQLLDLIIKI